MAANATATTDVTVEVLESMLREHLLDQGVGVTKCAINPFPHQGTNDSTSFFRAGLTWTTRNRSEVLGSATWIVKHWKAGGIRDKAAEITQPREILAWERGLLRPEAVPAGMVVPFIAGRLSPDKTESWLAMEDVSTELAAYPRLGLTGDQVISRARQVLARLARLHAWWEQPERQEHLHACSWLPHPEAYLWDLAHTYALALEQTPHGNAPSAGSGPPVWDELPADLHAFLDWRPADERELWAKLLIDRQALVDALTPYPRTLLHKDLDDRNIGLRWPASGAESDSTESRTPDLVLIDWEWISAGPAAIDVAKIVQMLPLMIIPGTPVPEAFWTNELADDYFEHYRAAGGRCANAAEWRRSYGLALVAESLTQMPFVNGNLLRVIRGELPLPEMVGMPAEIIRANLGAGLPIMERMVELAINEAYKWLG